MVDEYHIELNPYQHYEHEMALLLLGHMKATSNGTTACDKQSRLFYWAMSIQRRYLDSM